MSSAETIIIRQTRFQNHALMIGLLEAIEDACHPDVLKVWMTSDGLLSRHSLSIRVKKQPLKIEITHEAFAAVRVSNAEVDGKKQGMLTLFNSDDDAIYVIRSNHDSLPKSAYRRALAELSKAAGE